MSSRLGIVMPVAVIAVGAALAGCSSLNSSSTTPPASATGSTAAAQPASSASSGAGSAAAASSGSQAASASGGSGSGTSAGAWCTAAQLKISYTDNSQINNGALDGMSHVDRVVMVTNVSSTSCETGGYPGVAALDSSGKQIKQAARATDTSKTITLAPGAVASALVSANSASCDTLTTAAGLLVTAPNERTSTRLGSPGSFCPGSLQVGPLKPGNAAGLQV
jgi:hypothetical protein